MGFLSKFFSKEKGETPRSFDNMSNMVLSWRSVNSELINRVAYDSSNSELSIDLRNRGIYVYHNVPQSVFNGLMSAPSHGRFFNENIRDSFSFTH